MDQRDELSIHLSPLFFITILVGLGKIVLGVGCLLRIHEVCPERVLLVLDAGILELELGLAVLKFICNFVDPFLERTWRSQYTRTPNTMQLDGSRAIGTASWEGHRVQIL